MVQGAGGAISGVVCLEGSGAGLFHSDVELPYYLALDVSKLAQIEVINPILRRPSTITPRPMNMGGVHAVTDLHDQMFISMAVALHNRPQILLSYVHMYGPRCGHMGMSKGIANHLGGAAVVLSERDE